MTRADQKKKKKAREARELANQNQNQDTSHDEDSDDLTPPALRGLTADQMEIKPLYGKVENTALPEGYESSIQYKELDAKTGHLHTQGPLITSIPATYFDLPDDPLGNTEWMMACAATKAKVVSESGKVAGFTKHSNKHEVRDIPGMGKGVFATKDLHIGEPIFSERPLVVMPRNTNIAKLEIPSHYSIDDYRKVVMYEFERNLELCLERMSEERKAAFLSLANSHTEDGSGPLLGIARTNGYGLPLLCDGPVGTEVNDRNGYSFISHIGSRINHSCQPNIALSFFLDSFSIQFSACRPIKAGEQLFYPYCEIDKPKAVRNRALEPYGFQCQCPACTNATPASDKFRTEIDARAVIVTELSKSWTKRNSISPDNPGPNPKNTFERSEVEPVLRFKEALEKEGLEATGAYAMANMALLRGYILLKEEGKASETRGLTMAYCIAGTSGANQIAVVLKVADQLSKKDLG